MIDILFNLCYNEMVFEIRFINKGGCENSRCKEEKMKHDTVINIFNMCAVLVAAVIVGYAANQAWGFATFVALLSIVSEIQELRKAVRESTLAILNQMAGKKNYATDNAQDEYPPK